MARRYTQTGEPAPDNRSPLARVAGLGSAKTGVEHWWAQRVSAVALVPLTLWFVAALMAHVGSDYDTATAWLRTFPAATLMILLLATLFYHAALGLQVVIEDYVHSSMKFAAIVVVRLACLALAVAGIVAVLRIALTH
jgi:succinate dehydrogenase / fumarate reductase membrane anchor subunit